MISMESVPFLLESGAFRPWADGELADDVVFTVEYSIRSAMAAVYGLLRLKRSLLPSTRVSTVHIRYSVHSRHCMI